MVNAPTIEALLECYLAVGIDEFTGDEPVNQFANAQFADATIAARPVPEITAQPAAILPSVSTLAAPASSSVLSDVIGAARQAAAAATTLDALKQAVMAFDGCSLKKTATNTVFSDGNPASRVMLIGEAPGSEEDRTGRPFVGVSGQLLDRMLATIGLDRKACYITNVLFWRPPGNRKPTESEIAICRPFVDRHIALVQPSVLVLVGGTASGAFLPDNAGITRIRGRWFSLRIEGVADPIESIAMYHPSFLLRSPERKRDSWLDLLSIKQKLGNVPS